MTAEELGAVSVTDEKKITLIPRIRGKVIEVGKYFFSWEIWITLGSDEPPNGIHLQTYDKFLNFADARHDMNAHAPEILKQVCAAMGGTIPEEFIDLKEGRLVTEEEFKRPVSDPIIGNGRGLYD